MRLLLVLSLGLLLAAEDAKNDMKAFEGTWLLVSGEHDGKKESDEFHKNSRLEVKGDKHTIKLGDVTHKASHKLDTSKKPKTIDITRDDGVKIEAIYELSGDTFKICLPAKGKGRPKEFSAKEGSGQTLHVWKRDKK